MMRPVDFKTGRGPGKSLGASLAGCLVGSTRKNNVIFFGKNVDSVDSLPSHSTNQLKYELG